MNNRKSLDDAVNLRKWFAIEVRIFDKLAKQPGNCPEMQSLVENWQQEAEGRLIASHKLVELCEERLAVFGEEMVI